VFEHVEISTNLLSHLSEISDLEIRHGEVLCRSLDPEISNNTCAPKRLLLIDDGRNPSKSIAKNLFEEASPLRLSKLTHLQISCRPLHLKLLSEPLKACSMTLSILELSFPVLGRGK
jgi:hypothetical protein